MNIRECKMCGKDVDFDEPWCDHETMEESAWLNMPIMGMKKFIRGEEKSDEVSKMAEELGRRAGHTMYLLHANELDAMFSGGDCPCETCKKVREEMI